MAETVTLLNRGRVFNFLFYFVFFYREGHCSHWHRPREQQAEVHRRESLEQFGRTPKRSDKTCHLFLGLKGVKTYLWYVSMCWRITTSTWAQLNRWVAKKQSPRAPKDSAGRRESGVTIFIVTELFSLSRRSVSYLDENRSSLKQMSTDRAIKVNLPSSKSKT